jgi:alpha-galactosidase
VLLLNTRQGTKIVVIGAGSASFGLSTLAGIMRTEGLRSCQLCLVDLDREGLGKIESLAKRLNEEWQAGMTISSTTDRTKVLEGADFVILSVAIDREACWKLDREIALHYGINHYAENGGPGAFAHSARNIAIILPILRDMEEYCPGALLLNFTNPVTRICTVASRYFKIKTVGICHQIYIAGYFILGVILADELRLKLPKNVECKWTDESLADAHRISFAAYRKYDIKACGLNHFTWMIDIRERATGRDVYPLAREKIKSLPLTFEPLTRKVYELFDLIPVPGDCHLAEYLPYTHNTNHKTWERYNIQMYDMEWASRRRDKKWQKIEVMGAGKAPVDELKETFSERAELIISSIINNENSHEPAVNLPNKGYITNLPEGAIVEVPALVSGAGVIGLGMGDLPQPIAALCHRQITINELSVRAAVEGDKHLALQALALDPMIDDPEIAEKLLNDYLKAFKNYLPAFSK